jgi:DNA polymerase-3 subunit gamma/tau
MSHQVLARKWRPGNFREMVGQEHVLKALINALDRDRLHHAYLFSGTRGVGKTTIARIFAKCLNCEQGLTSSPCGVCTVCTEIDQGRFLDLIEVDAASRTKVEDTRELMENVQYAPIRGRYKVYLIDEVHMLSNHSFNALLKTLEEPPPHVKFLLATTDPQKLPATILSRCLQFNLKNMPAEQIVGHLQHVLGEEAIDCDEAALWLIAEAARGSMRDALSLTDQAIGFGAGTLFELDVRTMLGTIDRHALSRVLGAVIAGDGAALFAEIAALASLGTDFQALLDELISLLHGIAVEQAVPGVESAGRAQSVQLAEFARALTGEDVQIFYQMALNGRRDFPYVPDPRRGFEMVALRLLTFRPLRAGEIEGVVPGGSNGEGAQLSAPQTSTAPQTSAAPATTGGGPGAKKSEALAAAKQMLDNATVSAQPTAGNTAAGNTRSQLTPSQLGVAPVAPVSAEQSAGAAATDDMVGSDGELVGALSLRDLKPEHWNQVFPRLGITGVTQNIVANAVLGKVDGQRLSFVVDEAQSLVLNNEHQQRWQRALADYFGESIVLSVDTGQPDGETPALLRQRLKAERLQAAVAELEQDSNVRMLQQRYGARLLTNTVKPIDRLPGETPS